MGTIRWGSLLTTPDGEIDGTKLKLVAILMLGLTGGFVMIAAAFERAINHGEMESIYWMAGICVAPLTGGAIGYGIGAGAGRVQVRAIQAGQIPGRRANEDPMMTSQPGTT